ncbi:MAG: LysR family transcriptional regulator [Planctomycetota bacterium]
MPEINFHHLRYFQAVAHEGNLTRAAQRLHVSQSAVSVQIKKLETQLGQDLFEREGRRLVLTEAGSIALEYADAVFRLGDELLGTLDVRGEATRRVLRVGALATLSRNFQIEFFQPLLGREDVEVLVRSGSLNDHLRAVSEHRLDVVLANVVPLRDSTATWVPHLIAEQPVSLVGHPDRRFKGRRLKDILVTEPLLLPTTESSIRTGFDALTQKLGVTPTIAGEIDDMAMLRLFARDSRALALVPPIVVRDELEAGELVEVRRLPELRETFFAITAWRRFPNPLLVELIPGIDEEDVVE